MKPFLLFSSLVLFSATHLSAAFFWSKKEEAPEVCCEPTPYYYDKQSNEFFLYGEWIYWKPTTQDPMEWSFTSTTPSVSIFSPDEVANFHTLSYDYSSGFRVGAGYRFGENRCDQIRPWQIEAEYTRLHTSVSQSKKTIGAGDVENIIIIPSVPVIFGNPFNQAKSRMSLEYDRLDFKLGWPIWVNTNIILRLLTGATFASFENNWKSRFLTTQDLTRPIDTTELKWRWRGGGLFGGGDIYIDITKHFGIFADSSFGLLFGRMREKEFYLAIEPDGSASTTETFKYRFNSFQPVVNFAAGIDYKVWLGCVLMQLAVGWEFTWWFDMNQFGRVNERTTRRISAFSQSKANVSEYFFRDPSDLGFQGLTARLGFDF
jgi:hypothetical protein